MNLLQLLKARIENILNIYKLPSWHSLTPLMALRRRQKGEIQNIGIVFVENVTEVGDKIMLKFGNPRIFDKNYSE